jgi:hypothetical protein
MAPGQFHERARTLGAEGVALDASLPESWVAAWAAETRVASGSLPVVALEAPCPRPASARAPRLGTADRDERAAALEATRKTLRLAHELGAPAVILRLGALEIGSAWAKVVRDFARVQLERAHVERLVQDRMKASARALDLARYGLEPLFDTAAQAGVTLALANRARWFEIPDAAELGVLLEDFRGAPLATWYDAAAGHARGVLGFDRATEWLALHGKHAAGAFLGDACGLRGGLPWGRGEVDTGNVESSIPEDVSHVVHVTSDATDEELAASLAPA